MSALARFQHIITDCLWLPGHGPARSQLLFLIISLLHYYSHNKASVFCMLLLSIRGIIFTFSGRHGAVLMI